MAAYWTHWSFMIIQVLGPYLGVFNNFSRHTNCLKAPQMVLMHRQDREPPGLTMLRSLAETVKE